MMVVSIATLAVIGCGSSSSGGGGGGGTSTVTEASATAGLAASVATSFAAIGRAMGGVPNINTGLIKAPNPNLSVNCDLPQGTQMVCTFDDGTTGPTDPLGKCEVTFDFAQFATMTVELSYDCNTFHPSTCEEIDGEFEVTISVDKSKYTGCSPVNPCGPDECPDCPLESGSTWGCNDECTVSTTRTCDATNSLLQMSFVIGSDGLRYDVPGAACDGEYSSGATFQGYWCETVETVDSQQMLIYYGNFTTDPSFSFECVFAIESCQ